VANHVGDNGPTDCPPSYSEEVIVVAPAEPEGLCDGCTVQPGVEIVEEPSPSADSAAGEGDARDLEDAIDGVEPMPATQRVVLVLVAVIAAAGVALLVAYWGGFLG
jgi:hypothetical protein